jgi:hypothetical protein
MFMDSGQTARPEKCLLQKGFQHDITAGDSFALTGPPPRWLTPMAVLRVRCAPLSGSPVASWPHEVTWAHTNPAPPLNIVAPGAYLASDGSYSSSKRGPATQSNSPGAIRWCPPLTAAKSLLASLPCPPLTEETAPLAVLKLPSLTAVANPLAVLMNPPLTTASPPLAVLETPPLTADQSPLAHIPSHLVVESLSRLMKAT